jgi:hypothetical protein
MYRTGKNKKIKKINKFQFEKRKTYHLNHHHYHQNHHDRHHSEKKSNYLTCLFYYVRLSTANSVKTTRSTLIKLRVIEAKPF